MFEMDRKQFEEWFKTTLSYAIFEDSNVWKVDLYAFNEPTNSYLHSGVQAAFESYQHQQAKVEELQTLYTQQGINMLKLQKRVQFLEQELGAWKGKSIAAMINGMCKQCGKEPWQAIVSDKEGYALLHCFGCGANKYELVGEQALKGEGQ
ncbi:TPA: hypothetical protein U9I79_001405 [Acinetobacter baumannii]|nr:hypothetical protein [Acinetobacter baumannii]